MLALPSQTIHLSSPPTLNLSSLVAQIVNLPTMQLNPGSGKSPGEWNGYPLQYSCLENPHGQRSLAGYSPWSHRVGHD